MQYNFFTNLHIGTFKFINFRDKNFNPTRVTNGLGAKCWEKMSRKKCRTKKCRKKNVGEKNFENKMLLGWFDILRIRNSVFHEFPKDIEQCRGMATPPKSTISQPHLGKEHVSIKSSPYHRW